VTLAAARAAYPGRRLVLAFQPHRYSRTRDLFEDFVKVLGAPDVLLLSEVYAAGEAPIVAADGRALAHALRARGKIEPIFVESMTDMADTIMSVARDGDVVADHGSRLDQRHPATTDNVSNQHCKRPDVNQASAIDVKQLGKVGVLFGGSSAEREVSLMSGTGVLAALKSRGVDAHAFDTGERSLAELGR